MLFTHVPSTASDRVASLAALLYNNRLVVASDLSAGKRVCCCISCIGLYDLICLCPRVLSESYGGRPDLSHAHQTGSKWKGKILIICQMPAYTIYHMLVSRVRQLAFRIALRSQSYFPQKSAETFGVCVRGLMP